MPFIINKDIANESIKLARKLYMLKLNRNFIEFEQVNVSWDFANLLFILVLKI